MLLLVDAHHPLLVTQRHWLIGWANTKNIFIPDIRAWLDFTIERGDSMAVTTMFGEPEAMYVQYE